MNDYPLPLDVARALVKEYSASAIQVAQNRADAARHNGEMKAHDHALMVLTEVEELVLVSDGSSRNLGFNDAVDMGMHRRLRPAKAANLPYRDKLRTGAANRL